MDESTSKRIKEISLEMLIDFDKFCREHGLQYSLSFGTLLGAVRHKGYIPWDDDIDVDMPIEDYIRFRNCWLKYGDKKKYFLQTKKTDPKLPNPFYRLRLNNTTTATAGRESFPIHWGIPLDIFPVYNMPQRKLFKVLQQKAYTASGVFCSYDWKNPNANHMLSWLCQQLTLFSLQCVFIISRFAKSSTDIYYPYGYARGREGKKSSFSSTVPILFEGVELRAYANPHAYLVWQYGEDYMTPPPEDQRQGHDIGTIDLEHDSEYYNKCLRRNK